ncbi:MAG: hypothetical protein WD844_16245 [Thermoleophilaceae bacterium]
MIRAPGQFHPLTLNARDDLTGASAALDASNPDVGTGPWDTDIHAPGSPDFTRESDGAIRTAASPSTRYAVLPDSLTGVRVGVTVESDAATGVAWLLARGTPANFDYLIAQFSFSSRAWLVRFFDAGVDAGIVASGGVDFEVDVPYALSLDVDEGGGWGFTMTGAGTALVSEAGQDDRLAPGGDYASGQLGFADTVDDDATHIYSDFFAQALDSPKYAIPPEGSVEVRHDDTVTLDASGNKGKPPHYRGARMYLPPGTSRIVVAARDGDSVAERDHGLERSTKITVDIVERGILLPGE